MPAAGCAWRMPSLLACVDVVLRSAAVSCAAFATASFGFTLAGGPATQFLLPHPCLPSWPFCWWPGCRSRLWFLLHAIRYAMPYCTLSDTYSWLPVGPCCPANALAIRSVDRGPSRCQAFACCCPGLCYLHFRGSTHWTSLVGCGVFFCFGFCCPPTL